MPSEFERAISVFAHGFAFTRSFTHPYLVKTLSDRARLLHDGPRTSGDSRTAEFIAHDIPVAELTELAREKAPGRYRICYMLPSGEPDGPIRAAFKEQKHRLMATEAFMIHRLKNFVPATVPYAIQRVTTKEEAERLAKAAGSRQILPEHLTAVPVPMRQYVALDGETPVGWVGSTVVGDCTWCNSMFVKPEYRRQGIARALLHQMLTDDRDTGVTANILLASHTGSKLYPTVGYEDLGMLYMYTPPKPSNSRTAL
jgi:GNAT superfamily N-acetyltransferase